MITVRFTERERYDIQQDAETICYMATTAIGTFFSEIPVDGPTSRRELRRKFREAALNAIQSGELPGELKLG